MIISRMMCCMYFPMPSFAFFFIVLHISAYSVRCFVWQFSTISRDFLNRFRVGDNILHFSVLLIALATLLCHVCDAFAHGIDVV